MKVVVTKKGKLTITVDLTQSSGESKSGKSLFIATTRGHKSIEYDGREIMVGVDVYEPLEA